MKNYFIILGLVFVVAQAFAVEKIYLQEQSPYYTRQLIRRPTYNPYINPYYSPYRYRNTNYNNVKRIQRINRIRQLNRIKNNFLSWDNSKNPFKGGSLTGYSTPINEDIYQKMGIAPMDFKQNPNSINCYTDLFTAPTGNEMYYRNGKMKRDLGSNSGKTGVTIIYD